MIAFSVYVRGLLEARYNLGDDSSISEQDDPSRGLFRGSIFILVLPARQSIFTCLCFAGLAVHFTSAKRGAVSRGSWLESRPWRGKA